MKTLKHMTRLLTLTILLVSLAASSFSQVSQEQMEKLQRALQFIEFAYIEELDDEKLVEDAIRGMLRELDPHSRYLSADELRRANEPLEGSFEGIGIQFDLINDTIVVVSPIPGGPSEKVGLMPGDKIVYINGEESYGSNVTNEFVQQKLRGERGTEVEVSIHRTGAAELLDFSITRDKIPIHSVDAAFMATPETGYIKINRFARTTLREVRDAISDLKSEGMTNLIVDLNYNSGGYLDVAIDLTDEFLERDQLIVYTEGHAAPRQEFKSTSRGNFKEGQVVVLINEGSASASEIFAGAIQDWDRGLIVGRRSFGKGLVQRPFELPDESAIRLTTAQYHTPTGRSIQKPYDEGTDQYYADLSNRLSSGELVSPENITFPDSLKYSTKINGRAVYGGGGIMPDFFTPLDTAEVSDYYSRMLRRGILNTFGIEYTNRNRQTLSEQYDNVNDFIENFHVDEALIDSLRNYAADQHDLVDDNNDNEKAVEHIKRQLKGQIARNLFDFSAYIQVVMQHENYFKEAIRIIEDDTFEQLQIRY